MATQLLKSGAIGVWSTFFHICLKFVCKGEKTLKVAPFIFSVNRKQLAFSSKF